MKRTSSFGGGSQVTKLSWFIEKSLRRHGVNSNWLFNGDDSTGKGGMIRSKTSGLTKKRGQTALKMAKNRDRRRGLRQPIGAPLFIVSGWGSKHSVVGGSSSPASSVCPSMARLWQRNGGGTMACAWLEKWERRREREREWDTWGKKRGESGWYWLAMRAIKGHLR